MISDYFCGITASAVDKAPCEYEVAEGEIVYPPSSFLQSSFWTLFKCAHGWKRISVVIKTSSTDGKLYAAPFYALIRSFGRFFSIAYIPLAPRLDFFIDSDAAAIADFLRECARALRPFMPRSVCFARVDPPLRRSESNGAPFFADKRLMRAPSDVQPPDTVLLDLTPGESEIIAKMKPKWRYNIRLADKKGVRIFVRGAEAVDEFYALYEITAKRDGIGIHAKRYYEDLLERGAESRGDREDGAFVRLYIAEYEGQNIAAIIVLFCPQEREAVYLYGASSNAHRNAMPAYALQWRAIRDAKAAGCVRYDFYGIPPNDDPAHPMNGLYRFKTGFGGEIVHRAGSWDIPLRPVMYRFYRIAERMRAFRAKRLKKIFVKKRRS